MNKRELLNKKMDILKEVMSNVGNSSQIFNENSKKNPEIVDKRLNQQKNQESEENITIKNRK